MGKTSIFTIYQNFSWFGACIAVGKYHGPWQLDIAFAFWALEIVFERKTENNIWLTFNE